MYLYEVKLIKLEKEFEDARKQIKGLQKSLEEITKLVSESFQNDTQGKGGALKGEIDMKSFIPTVKIQLDLAVGMIRLIKEQAGFYLKLCDKFDFVKLTEDLVRELSIRDKDLALEILRTIDKRWQTEFTAELYL